MADQADIDAVHDWTGDEPDDDVVNGMLDRLGDDVHAAALAILRRRRANLVGTVGKTTTFAVAGDYSQTDQMSGNGVTLLDADIARLEALTGTTSLPTVGLSSIHRHGSGR